MELVPFVGTAPELYSSGAPADTKGCGCRSHLFAAAVCPIPESIFSTCLLALSNAVRPLITFSVLVWGGAVRYMLCGACLSEGAVSQALRL